MKRLSSFLLVLLSLCLLMSSCRTVTIQNSAEAEIKLKELGYNVQREILYGDMTDYYKVDQVTILSADRGDDFVQVYYFTNKEDTETFYSDRARSLMRGVDVVRKNKYSIYRGTEQAVEDFLS